MAELADVKAALEREWVEFLADRNAQGKLTQAENWRRANPGEWARLQSYRLDGNRPPAAAFATSFGRQMAEHVAAYRLTIPAPLPAWPEAPRGTLTKRSGDTLIRAWSQGTRPGATEGIHVTAAPAFGLLVMQWPPVEWAEPYLVQDVISENVSSLPVDTGGTDEAAIWGGQTGIYRRFIAGRAEWMGVFSGSRCGPGSVWEHFRIVDQDNVGFYTEHVTVGNVIRYADIWSTGTCWNNEWSYHNPVHSPAYAKWTGLPDTGIAGSALNEMHSVKLRTPGRWSVYLDAGTFGYRIHDIDVDKPIRLPRQLMDPSRPNVVDEASINWNGIPAGSRIQYHDDPIGRLVVPRFAFGLNRGRIEGAQGRVLRDWAALGKRIDLAASA